MTATGSWWRGADTHGVRSLCGLNFSLSCWLSGTFQTLSQTALNWVCGKIEQVQVLVEEVRASERRRV